jgi:hypothetical protein
MMVADRKVYVVTLNWNGAADTTACVDSLRAMQGVECCFVVCDNASRPESLAALRAWGEALPGGLPEYRASPQPDWPSKQPQAPGSTVLIHTGGNLGYAGGMNVGMRYALAQGDANYVWVLNNDTVVAPDALSQLLLRVQQDAGIGICGSTLVYFDDRQKVQALGGAAYQSWRGRSLALGAFSPVSQVPAEPADIESRMAYVVGAAMLVTRDFLTRVGMMDDSYFLYSEEHDWAHRGRQQGFRLGYATRSFVFHKHGATIGTSPTGGSELSLFYLYRNKALFSARHHPLRLPSVLVWLAWDGLKFALKGNRGKAWAVLRGISAFPKLGRF